MNAMPETSKHTGIQILIHTLIKGKQPKKLMRFLVITGI
jgi:hypothetical protein